MELYLRGEFSHSRVTSQRRRRVTPSACMVVAFILSAGLMLGLPLALAGQAGGGNLVYGEREAMGSFNPLSDQPMRAVSDRLFSVLFEGLFRYDYEVEEFEPVLAESVQVEPGAGSALVRLRNDVLWHDGSRFTAEDVVASYEAILGNPTHDRLDIISLVESVESLGQYQVRFRFTDPLSDPERVMDLWLLPARQLRSNPDELGVRPIGTGPYQFQERNIEGTVRLTRFEEYWGGSTNLDRLEMRLSVDVGTMTTQLLADVLNLVVDLPPANLVQVENAGTHAIRPYQSYTIYTFAYNLLDPVLNDARVRRAFTMALNRQQMLNQWYDGRGEILAGPFVPTAPFFDPNRRALPYDPGEAAALLDAAGFQDLNGNGIRETPDGEPMELSLLLPVARQATGSAEQNVAQDFIDALGGLGIQVRLENVDRDIWEQRVFHDRDYQVAWLPWTFDPIYDISRLFHSRNIRPGGANVTQYANADVDRLLDQYAEAQDPALRRDLMRSVQGFIAQEQPYSFLFTVDRHAAARNGFVLPRIDPYFFFTHIRDWYFIPEFR
ncbi:MAG: ABC transporter substrate-binding protein [Gemmatimonadales bacterium]|nr:MAG: ABC transporter substrate-binding protein [Gemmatimonadales bacterium]